MSEREQFSSRLGFLLVAAGCAIGLGSVWRFPYITGQYGGAIFVFIYLAFLVLIGLPILTMELAVGRASKRSLGKSFEMLTPNTSWRYNKYWMILGNYILMAFYSLVTGWMLYYTYKVFIGDLGGHIDQAQAGQIFGQMIDNPSIQFICTLIVVVGSFAVCAFGVQSGVERITKPMMALLFILLLFLSLRSAILPGFKEGIAYYLLPDFKRMDEAGLFNIISAAMGQAFFTLGLGVGSIQIFGSYMASSKSISTEAITLTILNTIVALLAGFVIFPACFSYNVEPAQGPQLVFITLTSVFSNMEYGNIWGGIFFLFMLFAAVSTLIAVFENIIAISVEVFNISRLRSVVINCIVILILGIPCLLGYNVWKDVHPIGPQSTILDAYDFVLSKNILPFGTLCYILYISYKRGWGFDNYFKEVNQGQGIKISYLAKYYYMTVLPIVVIALFIMGYVEFFNKL